METHFTPLASLAGGVMIGIAATLLMGYLGRIAGMTGIMSGMIPSFVDDWKWRLAFLLGVIVAPVLFHFSGESVSFEVPVSIPQFIFGGLLVGIGAFFGSGCTSGHGICGIARFSKRSMAATAIFMTAAFATVYVMRHVIGGIG